MQVIGHATMEHLAALAGLGIAPARAHDALVAEGKRRCPQAGSILVQRGGSKGGFDVIAIL